MPVAPIRETSARCASAPSLHRPASVKAPANSVMPNGRPLGRNPAGTAIAARSMRFMKFV